MALLLFMYRAMGGKFRIGKAEEEPPPPNVPELDIILHEGAPYEITEIPDGQALSTIRIGVKNSGDSDITNCRVCIDAIDPVPAAIEVPIMLQEALYLPHMFPEILVDIATQRGGMNQYRFSASLADGISEKPSVYLDDATPRTLVVKVEAAECRQGASFKIWTDKEKHMHIKLISRIE